MWKFFLATGVPYITHLIKTLSTIKSHQFSEEATYLVAHIVVAGAIHVDIAPLLEPWGFNGCKLGRALCGTWHETLTGLDCPLVLEI